jgi:hypothetical protein
MGLLNDSAVKTETAVCQPAGAESSAIARINNSNSNNSSSTSINNSNSNINDSNSKNNNHQ